MKDRKDIYKIHTQAVDPAESTYCRPCGRFCTNRFCNILFPHGGCGCFTCLLFLFVLLMVLNSYVYLWNAAFSAFSGPWFMYGTRDKVQHALKTGDWGPVAQAYKYSVLLGNSVVIIGSIETGPMGGFVGTRGNVKDIKLGVDRKMQIASASKWFSGTVVYAVIEHPLSNLTLRSRPSEYFDFWNCGNNAEDFRCKDITVEKLLAFRSGLKESWCEYGSSPAYTWESCLKKIFHKSENSNMFDIFEYTPVGLAVAGLMALKEMQKIDGYQNATWDDLVNEFIVQKSGMEPAPKWDSKYFSNGNIAYDFPYGSLETKFIDPSFPGLSANLGVSPRQYAHFAHAFLSRKLVSEDSVREMTRSHGPCPMFYGLDLAIFQAYGQAMWYGGDSISHSVGYYGFFPWLDQKGDDPNTHVFGIVALNNEAHFAYIMKVVVAYTVPVILIGMGINLFCCLENRKKALKQRKVLNRNREAGHV